MNVSTLKHFGLTKPQAQAYICLVKNGSMTGRELSTNIRETRTNTYMILEKLFAMGLIQKNTDKRIIRYIAASPVQLQNLAEIKRRDVLENEKAVKDAMPALLSYYYSYQERPGIRFYQGKEGLIKMYEDQRNSMKDIHFLRSDADFNLLGDALYDHIEQRSKLGITTFGIQPDTKEDREYARNDTRLHRNIIWMPKGVFTAPVNIYVYGNKVGLISYGEEAIGTIIESPQLAMAFKQVLNVVRIAAPHIMKEKKKKGSLEGLFEGLPTSSN